MGLLDKLWDDVVAGPKPSEGLGKLRKVRLEGDPISDTELPQKIAMAHRRHSAEFHQFQHEARRATKGIPIQKKKPPMLEVAASDDSSSVPSSPSGMSPLLSPSMASPASREKAVRQSLFRQCNASTTACDLVVISALDK